MLGHDSHCRSTSDLPLCVGRRSSLVRKWGAGRRGKAARWHARSSAYMMVWAEDMAPPKRMSLNLLPRWAWQAASCWIPFILERACTTSARLSSRDLRIFVTHECSGGIRVACFLCGPCNEIFYPCCPEARCVACVFLERRPRMNYVSISPLCADRVGGSSISIGGAP